MKSTACKFGKHFRQVDFLSLWEKREKSMANIHTKVRLYPSAQCHFFRSFSQVSWRQVRVLLNHLLRVPGAAPAARVNSPHSRKPSL
jgi:hypothetical protein